MTPEQFVYWLNGFRELTNGAAPTSAQWKSVVEHLDAVFNKVTPPVESSRVDNSIQKAIEQTKAISSFPLSPYPGIITGNPPNIIC